MVKVNYAASAKYFAEYEHLIIILTSYITNRISHFGQQ